MPPRSLLALTLSAVTAAGCGTLIRAVKGEMTPIGAENVTQAGIYKLGRDLTAAQTEAQFRVAFGDLATIYLYKCVKSPSKVPKDGKDATRKVAGDVLLNGMHSRIAAAPLGEYAAMDGAAKELSALQSRMEQKCDAGKLGTLDPQSKFKQSVALATPEGRKHYLAQVDAELKSSLEVVVEDGNVHRVAGWIDQECSKLMPAQSYCFPTALRTLHTKGNWDLLVSSILSRHKHADDALGTLGAEVGHDALAKEVEQYLTSDNVGLQRTPGAGPGFRQLVAYMGEHSAWDPCKKHAPVIRAMFADKSAQLQAYALHEVAEKQCRQFDGDLIRLMAHSNAGVRVRAVRTIGALDVQKAKKHLRRLQWNDPYRDDGCWCYPVRDAAKQAFNKLEIAGG